MKSPNEMLKGEKIKTTASSLTLLYIPVGMFCLYNVSTHNVLLFERYFFLVNQFILRTILTSAVLISFRQSSETDTKEVLFVASLTQWKTCY